jgi:hypothetical protein
VSSAKSFKSSDVILSSTLTPAECAPEVATQVNVPPLIAVTLTTSLVRDTYVQSPTPKVGKSVAAATVKLVAPDDMPLLKVVAALLVNFTPINMLL